MITDIPTDTPAFKPIITSLLDTDFYKLTMHQIIMHRFSDAIDTEFRFKCRNPGIDFTPILVDLNRELDALCRLQFTTHELDWMRDQGVFEDDYLRRLRGFQLDRSKIKVSVDGDGNLDINARGYWFAVTLFEIPVLAIVNELYFRTFGSTAEHLEQGRHRLAVKIDEIRALDDPSFAFSDFGTRRRFSTAWHAEVVRTLAASVSDNLVGTSNARLAMELDLRPIGTMAHEYLQAAQVFTPDLSDSQTFALRNWADEYEGHPHLMVALTDVIGLDAFLNDFDADLSARYRGVRHDSGDPNRFAERMIAHYRGLSLDPLNRFITFSNALTVGKAIALHQDFGDRIHVGSGIGTSLTNDLGLPALNIVMKMTRCKGRPVAKLSDDAGKTMCDDDAFVARLRAAFSKKSAAAPEEPLPDHPLRRHTDVKEAP